MPALRKIERQQWVESGIWDSDITCQIESRLLPLLRSASNDTTMEATNSGTLMNANAE